VIENKNVYLIIHLEKKKKKKKKGSHHKKVKITDSAVNSSSPTHCFGILIDVNISRFFTKVAWSCKYHLPLTSLAANHR
jgi:hypothetical protein